jgi:citrate synthase
MSDRISSTEAARRLGVKVETVYAYVSRGLLASKRIRGGRGSTFDAAAVEALARSGARSRESFAPQVATAVALVTDDGLYFRGVDAAELSRERTVEEVAAWIWTGTFEAEPMVAPPGTLATVRASLPSGIDPTSRLRIAIAVAAALDPLRFDLTPAAVRHTARVAIACMVDGLSPSTVDGSIETRLWHGLTAKKVNKKLVDCLRVALILLADRGLAASTVAARAAASARAHPYAVISAGLGGLDGPLHGGAGLAAYQLLERVLATGDVGPALAEHLRGGRPVPGIGLLGASSDPRAIVLLDRLADVPAARDAVAAVRSITAALRPHGRHVPNVDLAVAALALAAGMPAGAGEAIFAVGRSVGWIAHAMEEYEQAPLRWRGREQYVGPKPCGVEPAERSQQGP